MSINRVIISGNLTRDPELRALPSGSQVLAFGVAVNDRRKNAQSGEWEDYPNYVDCTLFGSRAESLSRILTKGMKVALEGKLRYRAWEAQDGTKRSKLEVVVDDVDFMSQRSQGGYAQEGGYSGGQPMYNPAAVAPQAPVAAAPVAAAPAQAYPTPAPAPVAAAAPPVAPAPVDQASGTGIPDVYDTDIPF